MNRLFSPIKILSLGFLLMLSTMSMAEEMILKWEIYHPIKKEWIHLGEKGSVQEALMASGELPDPFYGTNEKLFQWIESYSWNFRALLVLKEIPNQKVNLHFPNVDTYATISVNGKAIGKTENSFRPYDFDVKSKLQVGENWIEVLFESPVNYHAECFKKEKTKLPAPNDVGKIAIAPYTRKPQYQFGWDWSLRMNTMGFWKPVAIQFIESNALIGKSVQTTELKTHSAQLHLEATFLDYFSDSVVWKSQLFGEIVLSAKGKKLHRDVEVQNPRLWWPKGQGSQELYEDVWEFSTKDNKLIELQRIKFGIRQAKLVQEKDEIGTSYEIVLNGRPIFCKGGDYIPQDVFPARVEDHQIVAMVKSMADANYNMVRVWGGGFYPDDIFYETCDQLGLMVWQDFMFACAVYPGSTEFLENVRQEFDYQIPRISSHPSVVLFNGNNEVDVAWKNWGFQAKYLIYGREAEKIESNYKKLFQTLLPERVALFTSVPYIHTSPLSNWGKEEYYNHGSQHYWGVWHGKDPIEDFDRKSGRFNAEYGFQSFPQMSAIQSFAAPTDFSLESEVMKNHQKSYVGNQMIGKQTQRLFGEPTDFSDFVYRSQLTQARAVSIAIASHRIQAPRCMGTLYWQVNDVWPAPTWSSIDYFGNWKALHYQVQRDFREIGLVEKTEELGKEKYFLVSSSPNISSVQIRTKVFDLTGKLLYEDFSVKEMIPISSSMVGENIYSPQFQESNCVFQFEVKDGQGNEFVQSYGHLPQSHTRASDDSFSFEIIYDSASSSGKIVLKNQRFMHQTMIFAQKPTIKIKDNLFEFLPGEHSIEFEAQERPKIEDFSINWL